MDEMQKDYIVTGRTFSFFDQGYRTFRHHVVASNQSDAIKQISRLYDDYTITDIKQGG